MTTQGGAQGPIRPGNDLDHRVRERASALGFDVVGFARADEPLGVEHERYLEFVARGMHGEMGYLADNVEVRRRVDSANILEGARTVICVGRRYARSRVEEDADSPLARGIARYARGQDYHNHLKKRLRRLADFVRGLAEGVGARALCDIEPLLERAWAVRSGLGFVGKNGLLITPGQGSYQLLGEVVTTLELTPGTPMTERCGECTRCLVACPTAAFDAPFVLDPRRCIAYLTIEKAGPPPPEFESAIGEHLFGCDVCQEVCPWNRTAPAPTEHSRPFHPLARWSELDLEDLVALDDTSWPRVSEGTPLRRPQREGLARNAVLVARSRLARGQGDLEEARRALCRAQEHGDPMVRALASRALPERSALPQEGDGSGSPIPIHGAAEVDRRSPIEGTADAGPDSR